MLFGRWILPGCGSVRLPFRSPRWTRSSYARQVRVSREQREEVAPDGRDDDTDEPAAGAVVYLATGDTGSVVIGRAGDQTGLADAGISGAEPDCADLLLL